jgi:hypothetical protein
MFRRVVGGNQVLNQQSKDESGARLGRWGAVGITLLVVVAASVWSAGTAKADHVQVGEVVTFLIRADAAQPGGIGGVTTEEIKFLGGPKLVMDVSGCGTGERPVQRIQIRSFVGAPTETVEAIIVSVTEPVEAGTRAGNGTFSTICSIGSTLYNRYEFTVTKS